jgi:4-hydroxyphenylpyruvate dioxygenase
MMRKGIYEYQKGGCGGFGKGNISELFKSEYEKTLETWRKTT